MCRHVHVHVLYLAEFVAVAAVDEVGVVEGVGPSYPATSSAASWEVEAGTSCVDGEGHGAELVEDSLAPPPHHHHHHHPRPVQDVEGEIPCHYFVASSS